MNTTNTMLGSQAASRGMISTLSRYNGSAKARVTNRARQNAHGARRKRSRTGGTSNKARKRFSAAKRICKNGRCSTTMARSMAPRKPSGGSFRPAAISVTGSTSQTMVPAKPRSPSQK